MRRLWRAAQQSSAKRSAEPSDKSSVHGLKCWAVMCSFMHVATAYVHEPLSASMQLDIQYSAGRAEALLVHRHRRQLYEKRLVLCRSCKEPCGSCRESCRAQRNHVPVQRRERYAPLHSCSTA